MWTPFIPILTAGFTFSWRWKKSQLQIPTELFVALGKKPQVEMLKEQEYANSIILGESYLAIMKGLKKMLTAVKAVKNKAANH